MKKSIPQHKGNKVNPLSQLESLMVQLSTLYQGIEQPLAKKMVAKLAHKGFSKIFPDGNANRSV